MHTITDEEKAFLEAAKDLVRRYGVNNGKVIIFEAERNMIETQFAEFVVMGKSLVNSN